VGEDLGIVGGSELELCNSNPVSSSVGGSGWVGLGGMRVCGSTE
jgi:hypothetical protein